MTRGLTKSELQVVCNLANAMNAFRELPVCHPSDLPEFEQAIHACQNILMARAAVRSHPDMFERKRGWT